MATLALFSANFHIGLDTWVGMGLKVNAARGQYLIWES